MLAGKHLSYPGRRPRKAGAATSPSTAVSPAPALPAALPRRHAVFAVVALALLLSSIDHTSVATALSTLQADLGTTFSWAGWTLTAYTVGSVVALPLAGGLGDRFGRRRVFLVAIAVFTVARLLCGLAGGIEVLIALRLVQGLAGGAFLPSATGIVADHFGPERDRAVALFTSVFPVGAIIGPVVGGLLLEVAGWRSIFLVAVPLGVVLFVATLLLVRETPRRTAAPVDVAGIALLVTVLLGGMYAITRAGTPGEGWAGPATAVAAGLLAIGAGVLFVRHAARHPAPLVPLRLLRGPGFGVMNAVNVLFGVGALGLAALVPHYAQVRYGIAPVLAGGLLTLRAVGMIIASTATVALLPRVGFRPLLLAGTGVHAVGLVMLALPPLGTDPVTWLAVAAGVAGLGMGLAAPSSNNAGMHLAPESLSAVAGLRGMFRQSGGIAGIVVTSAVVTASADPALAQGVAFAVLAGVLLLTVPLVLRLPNRRGRW